MLKVLFMPRSAIKTLTLDEPKSKTATSIFATNFSPKS